MKPKSFQKKISKGEFRSRLSQEEPGWETAAWKNDSETRDPVKHERGISFCGLRSQHLPRRTFPSTHTKQIPTTPRSCKEPLRGRLLLSDHLDVSDMSAFSKHAILWVRGISYLSSFFLCFGESAAIPFLVSRDGRSRSPVKVK